MNFSLSLDVLPECFKAASEECALGSESHRKLSFVVDGLPLGPVCVFCFHVILPPWFSNVMLSMLLQLFDTLKWYLLMLSYFQLFQTGSDWLGWLVVHAINIELSYQKIARSSCVPMAGSAHRSAWAICSFQVGRAGDVHKHVLYKNNRSLKYKHHSVVSEFADSC